jgi:hypothetical protein
MEAKMDKKESSNPKSTVGTKQPTVQGLFKVELTGVIPDKKDYGNVLIFAFKICEGENAGRIVKGMCTQYEPLIPKCKLYIWAKALLGRDPKKGEEIDWQTLVGTITLGEVVPKETVSGVFESVKRLFPEKFMK